MAAPKKVDYESIEPGWRAGVKSPSLLAAEYTAASGIDVSRAAIIKHFKKLGIPRNLKKKIQAKADSMVAEAMVTGKVSTATSKSDSEIIGKAATEVATILIAQRSDIARTKKITNDLLTELENMDPNTVALKERTNILGQLASTQKIAIALEREAWGITSTEEPDSDEPPPPRDDMEFARRIAFALTSRTQGLTNAEQAH